jgi:hypothetical protein
MRRESEGQVVARRVQDLLCDGATVSGDLTSERSDGTEEPARVLDRGRVGPGGAAVSDEPGVFGEQGLLGNSESAVEQREGRELGRDDEELSSPD